MKYGAEDFVALHLKVIEVSSSWWFPCEWATFVATPTLVSPWRFSVGYCTWNLKCHRLEKKKIIIMGVPFFSWMQMIVRPSLERKHVAAYVRKVIGPLFLDKIPLFSFLFFLDQGDFAVYSVVTFNPLVLCAAGAVQLEKDGCTHAPIYYNCQCQFFLQSFLTVCTHLLVYVRLSVFL